ISCANGERAMVLAVTAGAGADGALRLRADGGRSVRLIDCEQGRCLSAREVQVTCKEPAPNQGGVAALGAGGSAGRSGPDRGERGELTPPDSVDTARAFIAPEPPSAGFSVAEAQSRIPMLGTEQPAREFLQRELCG